MKKLENSERKQRHLGLDNLSSQLKTVALGFSFLFILGIGALVLSMPKNGEAQDTDQGTEQSTEQNTSAATGDVQPQPIERRDGTIIEPESESESMTEPELYKQAIIDSTEGLMAIDVNNNIPADAFWREREKRCQIIDLIDEGAVTEEEAVMKMADQLPVDEGAGTKAVKGWLDGTRQHGCE